MHLYFHKDRNGNFGDDLNPWLWPQVFPRMFSGETFHEDPHSPPSSNDDLFLGIGTLLNTGVPKKNKKFVFGSGMGYGQPPVIDHDWHFSFVRGPLTASKLGLSEKQVITDPAIIAIDFTENILKSECDIAYMPHCASIRHGEWNRVCDAVGIRLIDPQDTVENVIANIANSRFLVTEALHGAIVADSLRIPWVPVITTNQILEFKWLDWCSSMEVNYSPRSLVSLWKPSSGVLSQLRYVTKLKIAEIQLKNIITRPNAFLSKSETLLRKKDDIYEQVEIFKQLFNDRN